MSEYSSMQLKGSSWGRRKAVMPIALAGPSPYGDPTNICYLEIGCSLLVIEY